MEGVTYSNLGMKVNRAIRENRDENLLTLKDYLDQKSVFVNELELKKIFIRELKNILHKENLFDLINDFFELETNLNLVIGQALFEVTTLGFEKFYRNLSPLILRSLLECTADQDKASSLVKSIKESLRIALEGELYRLEDRPNVFTS